MRITDPSIVSSMKIFGDKFGEQPIQRHIRLLLIFFAIALVAKGGAAFRGFAVDDYAFGQGFNKGELGVFLTQGRFLLGALDWGIDSLGVNINDLYISLGLCALLLQAALVLAVLRFVGAVNAPGVALVGSAMVVHPYLSEILTFRMVLPGYCVAAALSIVALEAASSKSVGLRKHVICMLATLGMLFVYQGFLNYFAVAIIFAFLFEAFLVSKHAKAPQESVRSRNYVALAIICALSVLIFLATLAIFKRIGFVEPTGRSKFISLHEIPERMAQVWALFHNVFWKNEPIVPHWLKVVLAFPVTVGIVVLCQRFIKMLRGGSTSHLFGIVLAVALLIPATVGVIVPFKDWYPVARVLPQVPVILGLLILLSAPFLKSILNGWIFRVSMVIILFTVFAFVLNNNQIFADPQRLNGWDRMEANRIVSRLEQRPDFLRIQFVYVGGGSWRHSAKMSMILGDMNISAFSPEYSKVPLLVEVSGYNFKKASGVQNTVGEAYCAKVAPWPDVEAVTVVDGLAIICLAQ